MNTTSLTADEIEAIERLQRAGRSGTHYDVLQLDQSAPKAEVDRIYKDLVRLWHPDRFFRRDLGDWKAAIDENFDRLTQAYVTLHNDAKRATYDRELRRQGITPAPRPQKSVMEQPREEVVDFRRTPSGVRIQAREPSQHASTSTQTAPPQAPKFIRDLKDQIAQRIAKARVYFEGGKQAAEAGNWPQAENNYYLATRYDPGNVEFTAAHKDAVSRSRVRRVATCIQQGDTAVSYGRFKEAIASYQKACEFEPSDGVAYFKLGQLLMSSEDDLRGAVTAWRKAALLEPRNLAYRVALAEAYEKAGLRQNAEKEARIVLDTDPKHSEALAVLKRLRTAGP